jgi:hypothetical protein
VLPTSGDFAGAVQALKDATALLSNNFASLDSWYSAMGNVVLTAQNGTEYTARTFKQMDADVQAIQDNNQALIDAASKQAIADVSLPEPDVYISFNDGIEIERGYGDRNVHGNKTVTFTRASSTGNVNKSGVSESLAIDEPAITSAGLCIYQTFTSEFTENNSILAEVNGWGVNDVTTTLDGERDFGDVVMTRHVPTDKLSIHNFINQSAEYTVGEYTRTIYISADELGVVQFGSSNQPTSGYQLCVVDFRDGIILSGAERITKLEKINVNTWLFAHKFTIDVDNSNNLTSQIFSNNNEQTWLGDNVSGLYMGRPCLTKTSDPMPPVSVGDSPKTIGGDLPSIPTINNLPAAGKHFTIMFDCAYGHAKSFRQIFNFSGGTAAISNNGVSEYFQFKNTDNVTFYSGFYGGHEPRGVSRYAARYDGDSITLFRDGFLVSSAGFSGVPKYGLYMNNYIELGHQGQINTAIKHFRIFHQALTDAQILAEGGAK